jgi:hypothetical protein
MSFLSTVCWATSAQQGLITAQHAFMQSLLINPAPSGCGAVTALLSALLEQVPDIVLYARVSPRAAQEGGVQGMAGSVQVADMRTNSLIRQQEFCALCVG